MRFTLLFASLLIPCWNPALACEEEGIKRHLLRGDTKSWEQKLEFVRDKRNFRGCDFKFPHSYRIGGLVLPEMTFDEEFRFHDAGKVICFERYDVNAPAKINAVAESKRLALRICIPATKPEKPA